MSIYFATNRQRVSVGQAGRFRFGERFSEDGPEDLVFGKIPNDMSPEALTTECIYDTLARKEALFQEIKQAMQYENHDTIIYVHGFRNNFADAVEGARKLQKALLPVEGSKNAAKGYHVVLFSWPADRLGAMESQKNYTNDRLDARLSGPALGRATQFMIDFLVQVMEHSRQSFRATGRGDLCGQKLHLICHSMGNYVLTHALQKLLNDVKTPQSIPSVFEEVVLVAADEDSEALEQDDRLKHLDRLARRVTVYYNPNDKALRVSHLTKGNPERLGAGGPRNMQRVSGKVVAVNVDARVDWREDMLLDLDMISTCPEHGYHLYNTAVIWDMRQVLAGITAASIQGREPQPFLGQGSFKLV
ncbi:MAG: alpha/beta hydrolase [Candidatus Melainabacteria bacterium]|nr:alpha/beta hydrolase [Candidatus Melainabacteria bacterium]